MVFKSAIAWWYWLVVMFTGASLVLAGLPAIQSGSTIGVIAIAFSALFALGIPLWMAFGTHYRVTSDDIHIKCGPFSWHVPTSEVTAIEPTRSVLSAPALSLDRLEIHYGKGKSIVVSPANKEAFINAVQSPPNE